MGVKRPYRRTCRQFVDGGYSGGNSWEYILHPKYAESPEHYIRAFFLIEKDLQQIFDFVEPADKNLTCYSFRIHEIFLRACIEVEANCKAILKENGYTRNSDLNMTDYRKIEQSHRLSSYSVKLPIWHDTNSTNNIRKPFDSWSDPSSERNSPPWYSAYNSIKHDRHSTFEEANLINMIDAVSGLVVLLSAQFYTHDFIPRSVSSVFPTDNEEEFYIGDYFIVKFPDDWPEEERYDFNWREIKDKDDPFKEFKYK